MLRGSLRQVSSRGEQCGSVLLGAASVLTLWAAQLHRGAQPFLRPRTCKSSVFQGGHKQPMGPMSSVGHVWVFWGGVVWEGSTLCCEHGRG